MSLVKTLAKVAIGAALAKGVSNMTKGGTTRRAAPEPGTGSIFGGENSPGGGLADMLGELAQGQGRGAQQPSGGLADILGGLMKGASGAQQQSSGGLSDLLGGLTGSSAQQTAKPGRELADMLGKMLGGAQGGAAQGGLGGLLESLAGGSAPKAQQPDAGSLGDMLNSAFQRGGSLQATPSQAQEDQASLLLRAIIQAAKSDGRIDAKEKEALMEQMGDITPDEAQFVQREFQRPVDVEGLVRDVPRGMEAQVYAMSLVGLDLDSQAEAQYLHNLGQALGIDPKMSNAIHQKMGEPVLYT